jgi:hypothetical protein
MATQSEAKYRQLHEAVDRILNGPDDSDVDKWVVQVLVDIGSFVEAAAPALDYEVGRVISGVDRPLGDFPSNLSWQGARLAPDPQKANAWIVAGRAARGDRPPPERQQRALAALLRPIANISLHSWFYHLADALDALRFGEVKDVVAPSASRLHGYKQGRTIWRARLRALEWVEFQYRAGLKSKTVALVEVASAFGISNPRSVTDWQEKANELFGQEVVREALAWSGAAGRRYRSLQDQLDSGELEKSAAAREIEYFEHVFGSQTLEMSAKTYRTQARRKRGVTRRP